MGTSDCIFCEILAHRAPGSFVYRDEVVAAFLTIGQINPGHLLIVPTRHAAGVGDLSEGENAVMFSTAQRLSRALRQSSILCQGINYWLADGEVAFQDVFHVHLHVIPRFAGDSFKVSLERKTPDRRELDQIARSIARNLGSG
jgi:diadenosine tetraphosphate (Ap4A) HIT family hydrolase